MIWWFGVVVLIAAPVVVLRRWVDHRAAHPVEDPEALADAEREVRELDAFASPEDASDLPDWGPGAPR